MKIVQSSFHPVHEIEGKMNYKEQYCIDGNGLVKQRIFLNIPDPREREEIVLKHFLKYYTKVILRKNIHITVLGRDDPWDFRLAINDSIQFNIEITSIADDKQIFVQTKNEEYVNTLKDKTRIRLRDLKKLMEKISPDFDFTESLKGKTNLDEEIDNPLYNTGTKLWISTKNYPIVSYDKIIANAIAEKENKKHKGKENTILLIDNRSTHIEIEDVNKFLTNYSEDLKNYSFKEIWLYTGYYSDYEGNDCEFSFSPLKITEVSSHALEIQMNSCPPNENGVSYI